MAISIIYETSGQEVAIGFDAIFRETHRGSAKVTRHPVEKGVDVADNVKVEPNVFTMEGAVSEVSLDGQAVARLARALDLLEELKDSGELVTVATPHRTYENMKLTGYDGGRDAAKSAQLRVSLTFEKVRVVESQTVKVLQRKSKTPDRAGGKVDEGKQVATTASESSVRKSAFAKLVDGDYNFLGSGD